VKREPQFMPAPWSSSRAAQMINDLEAPVAGQYPEILQMRAALRRGGAVAASMTGSGSTVFGLFDRRHDAQAALDQLAGSGWGAVLTESLGRAEHERSTAPRAARV
jgi:4-diphosphocytidyl-2C-methyl-D-erythritol kinase